VSAPKRWIHETGADTQVCPYCGCTIYSKTINARLNSGRRYATKKAGISRNNSGKGKPRPQTFRVFRKATPSFVISMFCSM
jgi:hypothetical protein